MSRIERIQTKQGHPVPKTAIGAQGPFPRELYMSMPVVVDYDRISGNGGPEVPFGSTAQNEFKPLRWVRCTECMKVFKEQDADNHTCDESLIAFYAQQGAYDEDEDWNDEDDDWNDEDDVSSGKAY